MRLARKVPLLLVTVVVAMGLAFAAWLHVAMTNLAEASARASAVSQLRIARSALESAAAMPPFALIDDPATPRRLAEAVQAGRTATWLTDGSTEVWAATRTQEGYLLAVHVPWDAQAGLVSRLDTYLGIGVVVTTLLTGVIAAWFARSLGRRFGAAEAAARDIAGGAFDVRVHDVVRGRDEVAALGAAIDQLASSMQERLQLEKRVTADIAHDLRTPVTGLVTAAELLPDDRASTLVRTQVARLRRLVEDLLEVARLDAAQQDVEAEDVTTGALAAAASAASSRQVPVYVLDDSRVTTDPRRVQRILVNLLENALRHGADPVEIIVDGRTIAVRDHGPGFPDDLIREGPKRFRTGAADRGSGHGLGLTIAAGQARAVGARLEFCRAPDGGAEARVTFP